MGVASERMLRIERSRGKDSSRNLDFVHIERIIPIPTGSDGSPLAEETTPPGARGTRGDHVTHRAPPVPPAGSGRDVQTLVDQTTDEGGASAEAAEDVVEVCMYGRRLSFQKMWSPLYNNCTSLHSMS